MGNIPVSVFWFRRDLRLIDNAGLYNALMGNLPVVCIFIFDKDILDDLYTIDARVEFIHSEVTSINKDLQSKGSTLKTFYGTPAEAWKSIIAAYDIRRVYINSDYEPYARKRDENITSMLHKNGVEVHFFKDQVIFEKDEITKDNGKPYVVFTPYSRKWLDTLKPEHVESYTSALRFDNFLQCKGEDLISLDKMGFKPSPIPIPSKSVTGHLLRSYDKTRDTPAIEGTSRLGIHLRFGTISIRKLVSEAKGLNKTYLNELIWREFYQMILWHFPNVITENFNPDYNSIPWKNKKEDFERWREGKTGYPIVDAGMRQLNETGFMHNRVRMITASFLSKHLLIDWRWGEAYFAEKLLDYELASNNGGWQWAAGTGVDAAPYFRVFNPELQEKRVDPEKKYIKRWVKEYGTADYPAPMVDHKEARERAISVYKKALQK